MKPSPGSCLLLFWVLIFVAGCAFMRPSPPILVSFTPSSATITKGESVTFRGSAEETPDSWQWTFEGGTPSRSSSQSRTVRYDTPGQWDVTLDVTKGGRSGSKTVANAITVIEEGPTPPLSVSINPSSTTITQGESVTFRANSEETPDSWQWSFPGGSPSQGSSQVQTVRYNTAGQWDVSIKVTKGERSGSNTIPNAVTVNKLPVPPPVEEGFFADMESGYTISGSEDRYFIRGASQAGDDWNRIVEDLCPRGFYIDYQGGSDPTYQESDLVPDPDNRNNRVLRAINKNDPPGGGTSRWQCQCLIQEPNVSEFHVSYRMRIADNVVNTFKAYPQASDWFEFFEVWEDSKRGESSNPAGRFRWYFGLKKDEGPSAQPYWFLKAQTATSSLKTIWTAEDRGVPIPTGWFKLEVYYREGLANKGRLYIAITPDGGRKSVLFDIQDKDLRHPAGPWQGLDTFQFLKLYLDPNVARFLTNAGYPSTVYYDDIRILSEEPVAK